MVQIELRYTNRIRVNRKIFLVGKKGNRKFYNMAQDLYMAKDLATLEKICNFDMPPSTPYLRCLHLLEGVNKNAEHARLSKDEEKEFFFLHRYFIVITYLSKNENPAKDPKILKRKKAVFNKAQENLNRYEELKTILTARYRDAEIAKALPEVPTGEPKKPNISKRPVIPDPTSGILAANEKGFIECNMLYSLIASRTLKELVLIFDVRPAKDFKASHLTYKNLLNIPAEILSSGMSADSLSKKLEDPGDLWSKRGDADLLVLLDWSSSSSTPRSSSKVFILQNILTLWDPLTNYKSKPVILEGGYEEVIERYPKLTTDPKVEIPRPLITSSNDALSSLDYPMEELEPRLPPPPKVPDVPTPSQTPSSGGTGDMTPIARPTAKSAPAVVDRSTKPTTPTKPTPENINRIMDELADSFSDDEPPAEPSPSNGPQTSYISPTGTSETTPMEYSSDEEVALNGDAGHEESVSSSVIRDSRSTERFNREEPKKPDPTLVENLRKLKPSNINNNNNRPDSHGDDSSAWSSTTANVNDVSLMPLRDEPSSGILKRSSSSPNISKMGDDESVPSFSRANKPATPRKQFIIHERLDSVFGRTAPGLTGLKNFANNCYMNSIVQCLSNTEPLVTELVQNPFLQGGGRRQGKVAQEMITAFRSMWSGEIRVYSIRELKSLMGDIKEIFKGSLHQDSNEFLIILLEHLHEDLNVPAEVGSLAGADDETGEKAWGEFRRKNCSIIQQLFYGQHKSTVTCESCGHASATFEQFFNLFVPIPSNQNSVTLNDCLQLYMSGERISGWKCPECKVERNATKKIDISRLPPVLVIALKRFTQENDSWLHKKENLVTYPLDNLDMRRYTVPKSEQRHKVYSLYAMSTHSGTLQSGHYRAICKNFGNNRWYMFDDSSVDALSESNVLNNSEVYILFYISKQS